MKKKNKFSKYIFGMFLMSAVAGMASSLLFGGARNIKETKAADVTKTVNMKGNIKTYASGWEVDPLWSGWYGGNATFYVRTLKSSDVDASMVDSTFEFLANKTGGGISWGGNWDVAIKNAKFIWQLNDYSKYISAYNLTTTSYNASDLIVNLYGERSGTSDSLASSNTGVFNITNSDESINCITLIDTHTSTSAYGYQNLTYTISDVSTVSQKAEFFSEAFVREFASSPSAELWSTFETRFDNITDAKATLQAVVANVSGTIQQQAMYYYDTYVAENPSCSNYLERTGESPSIVSVTSVSLNKNSSSLEVGSTEQLTATVSPDNASDKSVSWASSNEAIATVNSTGLVTGVTAGSATITVTSNSDNTKTASCEYTVTSGSDEPTSSDSDSYTKIIINSPSFALTTLKLSNFTFESGYSLTNLDNYYETYYGADPVDNINRNTTTRGYGLTDSDTSIVLCYGGNGGTYIYHIPSWVTGCESYLWYNNYLDIPLGNINNLYSQTSNGTGSGSAGSGASKIITVQFNQWNPNSTISVSDNFYASKDYPMVVNAWNDVDNFFVNADVGLYCWSDYPLFSARTVKVTQLGSGQLGYTILPKGTEYFKVVKAGSGLLPCSGWPSSVSNEWGTWPFDSTKNVVTVKYYSGDQEYNEYRELLIQGMPVMFDTVSDIQSWWFGDGNRFFINVDGITQDYYGYTSSDAWFELTRMGQTGYMYYVPTTTVLCTRVIVTRNSSSGSGWNNKYNQTTDMTTNYGFNPLYTTQVLSSTTDGKQDWSPLGATETASEFGYYFMDKITCNNGATAPNVTNWNATETFYDGLTSDVQDTASNAIASESGNNIQQAVARYDYIVGKYGSSTYNDYLERNPSSGSNGALISLLSIRGSSASTIIIILSTILAASAVCGYFYLRKKNK